MTEFNKEQSTSADLMKFGMQKYVGVCGTACVCVCVCACDGGAWGIMLMKNKFQKASITSAHARAPSFAFQCEVQPPLFMMLYTSKPQPASLYLTRALSPPHIPIVTTSPGSTLPQPPCVDGETAACGMVR